jgi:hypothetical protein
VLGLIIHLFSSCDARRHAWRAQYRASDDNADFVYSVLDISQRPDAENVLTRSSLSTVSRPTPTLNNGAAAIPVLSTAPSPAFHNSTGAL